MWQNILKPCKIWHMSQKRKTTTKKPTKKTTKKQNRTAIIFWTCVVLLGVPLIIFGWILFSSWLESGKPVLGDRYDNNLNPAITDSQLSTIESGVNGISGVESSDVRLVTATLRVYADIDDSANSDTAFAIADNIYNTVIQTLDVNTYFSQASGQKMYDLEIHVYNMDDDRESDAFVYVVEVKNSSMEAPSAQLVSVAIDEEMAQQLRDNVEARNNPTPEPTESTDEITVGGDDVEATPETTEETE